MHMVDYVNKTPIYIIDHLRFWPPSPRGATKKFEIKCAFLLTQTVAGCLCRKCGLRVIQRSKVQGSSFLSS